MEPEHQPSPVEKFSTATTTSRPSKKIKRRQTNRISELEFQETLKLFKEFILEYNRSTQR